MSLWIVLILEPSKAKDLPISDVTRRGARHKAFLEEKGVDEELKGLLLPGQRYPTPLLVIYFVV